MAQFTNEFEGIHVGTTIHNSDGTEFAVVAINPERDRTLLVEKDKANYIGAWGLQQCRDGSGNWYWLQGHYFNDNFFGAAEYVNDGRRVLTMSELADCYNSMTLMVAYIMRSLNVGPDYAAEIYPEICDAIKNEIDNYMIVNF